MVCFLKIIRVCNTNNVVSIYLLKHGVHKMYVLFNSGETEHFQCLPPTCGWKLDALFEVLISYLVCMGDRK